MSPIQMTKALAFFAALGLITHAASAPAASGNPMQPMACSAPQAAMGASYRWPSPNPGMVAPLNVVWNYPVYRNPLTSSFTGESILIEIPADLGETSGFHLGTKAVPAATDEKYRLRRLAIRRPAKAYSGLGQALPHVMEMVLIHKEENGDKWANVILPFQVSTDGSDMDIINPIIDGAKLPDRIGESGHVMASAVSELQLSPGFDNATFSEFWSTAPASGCKDKNVNVRFFMRTSNLNIGVDTFQQLGNALQSAPMQEPTQPPEMSWTIGTCRNGTGTCSLEKAEDMQAKLQNMQKYMNQALTEQRTRKADLEKKLKEVQVHKGPATNKSIAAYDAATSAFKDLKSAASELTSAEANAAQIQTFATEASSAKWDQDAPKAATKAVAVQTSANTATDIVAHPLPSLSQVRAQDAAPSAADGLLASFGGQRLRGTRRVVSM